MLFEQNQRLTTNTPFIKTILQDQRRSTLSSGVSWPPRRRADSGQRLPARGASHALEARASTRAHVVYCEGQCHGLQCQGCKNSTKLSSVVSFLDNDQNYRPLFQKRSVSTLMWTIKSVSQPRRLIWVRLQPQGGHDAYATGQARDVASPHGHHVAHLPPPGPCGTAVGVLYC